MTRSCRRNSLVEMEWFSAEPVPLGGEGSPLRQSRPAQPIKTMLGILGVLVDGQTFPAFNREPGVDPQHLGHLSPGLLNLSQLRIGGCQPNMRHLQVRQPKCAF